MARIALVLALLLTVSACGRGQPRGRAAGAPVPLAVEVYGESGRDGGLGTGRPAARAWLASVSPDRAAAVTPTRLAPPEPALPEPEPGGMPSEDAPGPGLTMDPGLKPPVLRAPGVLELPPGRAGGSVELDVRVDEKGAVAEAVAVGAGADSALVAAARRCALGMRFWPALREGRPVAVWCRQRFDVRGAH